MKNTASGFSPSPIATIRGSYTLGQDFATTSGSYVTVTDAAQGGADFLVTIDLPVTSEVDLMGKISISPISGSGANTIVWGIGIDGADPVSPYTYTEILNDSRTATRAISAMTDTLTAGVHHFRIKIKRESGTSQIRVGGQGDRRSFLHIRAIY